MDFRHFQQQRVIDAAEKLKKLDEFNAKQTDWYVKCPKCHTELYGSLEDIGKHKCGLDSKG
jgi:hypothetical protein